MNQESAAQERVDIFVLTYPVEAKLRRALGSPPSFPLNPSDTLAGIPYEVYATVLDAETRAEALKKEGKRVGLVTEE